MRLVAKEDFELAGRTIPAGTDRGRVAAGRPTGSRRTSRMPERFDPGRYLDPRQEDLQNRWTWIPFGAGKHRCVGNAFAMMQLKAIFSVILRDFEFELAQPLGVLPRRLLQDGDPAPAALPGPLPAARAMRGRRRPAACARGTRCARSRRRRSSASTRTPTWSSSSTSTRRYELRERVKRAVRVLPGDGA